jgi:hypothetical protein
MGYSKIISTVPSDIQIKSTTTKEYIPIKYLQSVYLLNNTFHTAGWILEVTPYTDKDYTNILFNMLNCIDLMTISIFADNTEPIMTYSNILYYSPMHNNKITFVVKNRSFY